MLSLGVLEVWKGAKAPQGYVLVRKGEGVQFSVKALKLREGKWLGGEKRRDSLRACVVGLWVRSSSEGKGRPLVNSFGLAHFKTVASAKSSALP